MSYLFTRRNEKSGRARRNGFRPGVEACEARQLMAGNLTATAVSTVQIPPAALAFLPNPFQQPAPEYNDHRTHVTLAPGIFRNDPAFEKQIKDSLGLPDYRLVWDWAPVYKSGPAAGTAVSWQFYSTKPGDWSAAKLEAVQEAIYRLKSLAGSDLIRADPLFGGRVKFVLVDEVYDKKSNPQHSPSDTTGQNDWKTYGPIGSRLIQIKSPANFSGKARDNFIAAIVHEVGHSWNSVDYDSEWVGNTEWLRLHTFYMDQFKKLTGWVESPADKKGLTQGVDIDGTVSKWWYSTDKGSSGFATAHAKYTPNEDWAEAVELASRVTSMSPSYDGRVTTMPGPVPVRNADGSVARNADGSVKMDTTLRDKVRLVLAFLQSVVTPENATGSLSYTYDNGSFIDAAGDVNVTFGRLSDGRLQGFAVRSNGTLATEWQNANGSWSGWNATDAPTPVSSVSTASLADGRLALWIVGRDGSLWSRQKTTTNANASWTGWAATPVPAAVRSVGFGRLSDGRLQGFAVTSNGGLATAWQTSSGSWTNWSATDAPTSARTVSTAPLADGRLSVSIVGWDGTLWSRQKTSKDPNASWTPWSSTAVAGLMQEASFGRLSDGRLQGFAVRSDGTLATEWQNANGSWTGWSATDAPTQVKSVFSAPLADGRLVVWIVGRDGSLWSRQKTSTNPNGSWTGWTQA